MSKDYHIYFETGAIGDTALNLCRANIAMSKRSLSSCIVHTSPIFQFGNPKITVPSNPDVIKILENTNFIKDVVFDIDYSDAVSFRFSQKYQCPIEQPNEFREYHDIKEWVDLKQFNPHFKTKSKVALFQPVSLKYKPQAYLDCYIPVWRRCVETLLKKKYHIIMVGSTEDPIDACVPNALLNHIDSKIGIWEPLQSLAFLLYQADIVLSCDSWAGIWGAAARKPTAIAWGYRMEQNIDFWVTGFLGNRDCYEYAWASQKDYSDAYLANYLSKII